MRDYNTRSDIETDAKVVEEVREIIKRNKRDLNFASAVELYRELQYRNGPHSRPYISADITILL